MSTTPMSADGEQAEALGEQIYGMREPINAVALKPGTSGKIWILYLRGRLIQASDRTCRDQMTNSVRPNAFATWEKMSKAA
jgi:hypothetical protein